MEWRHKARDRSGVLITCIDQYDIVWLSAIAIVLGGIRPPPLPTPEDRDTCCGTRLEASSFRHRRSQQMPEPTSAILPSRSPPRRLSSYRLPFPPKPAAMLALGLPLFFASGALAALTPTPTSPTTSHYSYFCPTTNSDGAALQFSTFADGVLYCPYGDATASCAYDAVRNYIARRRAFDQRADRRPFPTYR